MKYLLLLIFAGTSSQAFMSHDEIVKNMSENKVGKAPQMGKDAPKPQYNKIDQILPNRKSHKKKHHHKSSYSKASGK